MSDKSMLIMETLLCTGNKTQHLFTYAFSVLNILLKIPFIFFREKNHCGSLPGFIRHLGMPDCECCQNPHLISEFPTRL